MSSENSTSSPEIKVDQKFDQLGLFPKILPALEALGYETPSPVQQKAIPVLLEGKDLLAQAQTGTGKTAAFALPILSKLVLKNNYPQALILTPTRELALQVAEAFQSYAKFIPDFRILPIYGGQEYGKQLKALKRGVHVVVGTPGRVMDHLRRKTLNMEKISMIVLDEADEMLKMGFIDDVTWILQQVPAEQNHQTSLFSATIPTSIQKIANQYLRNPVEIRISPKTKTVAAIKQSYMSVANDQKLNALTRYLEVEDFDAVLIFTRTKNASTEIAEKLEARGYAAEALNGDMSQSNREKVIAKIKNKKIDIIVATDVAARGIDIDRVSHVVSYDIPYDTGSYVHRIGRTGRAGREGKALLLVTGREQYMLRDIERAINQSIAIMKPPSVSQVQEKRMTDLAAKICSILAENDLSDYRDLVKKIAHKNVCSELDIAAALVCLTQKDNKPMQEIRSEPEYHERRNDRGFSKSGGKKRGSGGFGGKGGAENRDRKFGKSFGKSDGKKGGFGKSKSGGGKPFGKSSFAKSHSEKSGGKPGGGKKFKSKKA